MKIKATILMLIAVGVLLGCKPQADSGAAGSTPSTPTGTPAALARQAQTRRPRSHKVPGHWRGRLILEPSHWLVKLAATGYRVI